MEKEKHLGLRIDAETHKKLKSPVSYTHLDVYKRQGRGECP